jgi:SAM-dependent methyltransferase
MDLADLFNYYYSDKDTNGYTHLYSILFDKMKNDNLNILEIGIGTMVPNVPSSMKGYMSDNYKPGASLRAWRDYFKNSNIIGVDIQPDTIFTDERIKTYICDSTDKNSVENLMKNLNIKFDIIIDDGYHHDIAQLNTLKNFLPHLKDGGLYIIEDIYPGSIINSNPNIIKSVIDNYEYFFVGLKNNQCVIRKNKINAKGFC